MTEPMTDLPARLRAFAEHHDSTVRIGPWTLAREAADEIERLREALRVAQRAFADVAASDRVDEIEDVLNPGWRDRWYSDGMRLPGEGA